MAERIRKLQEMQAEAEEMGTDIFGNEIKDSSSSVIVPLKTLVDVEVSTKRKSLSADLRIDQDTINSIVNVAADPFAALDHILENDKRTCCSPLARVLPC